MCKKDRVIIIVEGGLVQQVYSTNSDLDVDVLDNDLLKEGDPETEQQRIEHAEKLKKELDDPNIQFSEVY